MRGFWTEGLQGGLTEANTTCHPRSHVQRYNAAVSVMHTRADICCRSLQEGRVRHSPADWLILLLLDFSGSSTSASSAAEGSKRGSLCRPAMVGRKNGAFAAFLGGCTGLLRACRDITAPTTCQPEHPGRAGCIRIKDQHHKRQGDVRRKEDQVDTSHHTKLDKRVCMQRCSHVLQPH